MFLAKKLNKGAGTPTPPATTDPQFNYVTMLLHADGTNGAQNNTFIDSSSNAFSITRNGNTTQGSFGPFGSNWSNTFVAGSGIKFAPSSVYAFGTGAFTGECWLNIGEVPPAAENIGNPSTGGGQMTLFGWAANDGSLADWRTFFCITSSTGASWDRAHLRSNQNDGKNNVYNSLSSPLVVGTWYHIAFVRPSTNSANLNVYINGVFNCSLDITNADFTFGGSSTVQTIGYTGLDTFVYSTRGYISNARSVVGSAIYTSNFTPSTTPLTAVSGTSVLTCQSNRFKDNSTNNFSVTQVLTPTVQRFNPFGTATAYDSSVIGGSAYLDGAGDYLSLASNSAFTVGTGNVTIEAWIYAFSSGSYQGIISGRTLDAGTDYPGLGLVINAGVISFTIFTNTSRLDDTVATPLNQWLHVVGVRSGTNAALFVNGVRKASSTNSENSSGSAMNLGRFFYDNDGYYFDGYISNARIVKGTAVYDPTLTTLTVPTAPLTAVSGTSLLTRMINGAIFDNAMIKNFETVGNAQISTSVKKYGTGSLYFDGTGDYLYETLVTSSRLSGDFTLEAWVYSTTSGSNKPIINIGDYNGSTGLLFYKNSADELALYTGNSVIMSGGNISANTWIHVAAVRSGTGSGNVKLYLNGTSVGTPATNTSIFSGRLQVGADYYNSTVSNYFTGYMDDLRITNGYARYTANFTPPTAAFFDTGPV